MSTSKITEKNPSVESTNLTIDATIETDQSTSECIALSDEGIVLELLPGECSQEEDIEAEEINSPLLLLLLKNCAQCNR